MGEDLILNRYYTPKEIAKAHFLPTKNIIEVRKEILSGRLKSCNNGKQGKASRHKVLGKEIQDYQNKYGSRHIRRV